MIKNFIFLSVILAVGLFSGLAMAQEKDDNKWALGTRYTYFDPDDADYTHNGNCYGLNLTYSFNDKIALELEGDYFKLQSKDNSKIGIYSIYANLQLKKRLKKFYPYLTGGVGLQHYSYGILQRNDTKDEDSSISYKYGVGLEYAIVDNWRVNFETTYAYGNTGGGASLDVYGIRYGIGLKYYF